MSPIDTVIEAATIAINAAEDGNRHTTLVSQMTHIAGVAYRHDVDDITDLLAPLAEVYADKIGMDRDGEKEFWRTLDTQAKWVDKDETAKGNARGYAKRQQADQTTSSDRFEDTVQAELHKARVREEVKRRLAIEQAGPARELDAGWPGYAKDRQQGKTRIEGLLGIGQTLLINGQAKCGKTNVILNLAHALVTGEPFLGKLATTPVGGTVTLLNYEMTAEQMDQWVCDRGITKGLFTVNLKGQPNPLASPEGQEKLAALLREVNTEVLIVDTFAAAFTGDNESSNSEVRPWLETLQRFSASEVGASELALSTHAGHSNIDRARGASALLDWPDNILALTKEGDEIRYAHAYGRTAKLPKDALEWGHGGEAGRILRLTGTGSQTQRRQASKLDDLIDPILDIVGKIPGINGTEIDHWLKNEKSSGRLGDLTWKRGDIGKAIDLAETRGLLEVDRGGVGRPNKHYPPTFFGGTFSGKG
jgi:hypothetical protein